MRKQSDTHMLIRDRIIGRKSSLNNFILQQSHNPKKPISRVRGVAFSGETQHLKGVAEGPSSRYFLLRHILDPGCRCCGPPRPRFKVMVGL